MTTRRYDEHALENAGHDTTAAFSVKKSSPSKPLVHSSIVSSRSPRRQLIESRDGIGDDSREFARELTKSLDRGKASRERSKQQQHQHRSHKSSSESGTGRDEESTGRSAGDAAREPPESLSEHKSSPSPLSRSQKKRRASDSFDLDDDTDQPNSSSTETAAPVVWSPPKPTFDGFSPSRNSSRTVRFREPVTLETQVFAKPKLSVRVDEVDDDDDLPLERLENVTALSRSLIPPELLKPPRPNRAFHLLPKPKMATAVTTASKNRMPEKQSKHKSFRKRLSLTSKKKAENRDEESDPTQPTEEKQPPVIERGRSSRTHHASHEESSENESLLSTGSAATESTPVKSNRSGRSSSPRQRRGVLERIRSVSRSRSRSRSRKTESDPESEHKAMLVAVTSCKSDAYYNQKAPGSTSKLPRKAPSNLKLFHELAVGVKDAYAALGATPEKPDPDAQQENGMKMSPEEVSARTALWEFVGNLDFLLALVDEVAVDTATRGALKDDTTFKCLRDVIKKCNKILEEMLVRRERKYTLFFRLVQPHEADKIDAIRSWNAKVEKAVGAVADDARSEPGDESDSASDTVSSSSVSTDASSASGRKSMFTRGRQLLPTAGRVRARRATPTPRLRQHREKSGGASDAEAAEDGFSAAVTAPVTSGNLAMLQRSLGVSESARSVMKQNQKQELSTVKPIKPKDELVDVIRGLREEKLKNRGAPSLDSELANLKPNWQPKADIPSAVPNLPFEYIHRHRLMKQVVNCLCDKSGAGPRDTDEETPAASFITSITSRHGDKAGNGKTTLAVAAIQTVEVRERFSDGIGWIHLGRNPLAEKDIRRLYDELFRQLFDSQAADTDGDSDDDSKPSSSDDKADTLSRGSSLGSLDRAGNSITDRDISLQIAGARRRFQGGDLEAIKEELGQLISQRKILICLDDVWRVEDAKWFIFDQLVSRSMESPELNECRILVTTRTPSLLGPGVVQEVFVRIFSEHEAVKLLLSSAGRRPYGGKNSAVFNQARGIVKGCGNAPLAVRIAGGMLRRNNRNWNLSSPIWKSLLNQCRLSLEEASRLRSFVHSVSRTVDLSFLSVEDLALRCSMRRCLVTFAAAFGEHEWVSVGRGIPQSVVLKLFSSVIAAGLEEACQPPAAAVLESLEAVHLLQRARHGVHAPRTDYSMDRVDSGADSDDVSLDADEPHRASIMDLVDNSAFVISDAVKAVAEGMAKRVTPAFLPTPDEYTSFTGEIEAEKAFAQKRSGKGSLWASPFRRFADQLSPSNGKGESLGGSDVHDLVVGSLLSATSSNKTILESFYNTKETIATVRGGDKLEEYLVTFMPNHLIRAQSHSVAAEFLVDPEFVRRRVRSLGMVESTRRQVTDLLDLRRECSHGPPPTKPSKTNGSAQNGDQGTLEIQRAGSDEQGAGDVDGNAALRDGCRLIIEEVYRHDHDSLDMALCLSLVGDGLMKGKQQRDAMLRLEEALGIYRGILGNTSRSIDVGRSLNAVARALAKIGENRVALLKFAEATRIYDACNANLQYDAISNAQNYASLLVDVGDWSSADAKFEEVFTAKKTVYGANSVPVAKAINSYAILLAKYGRMDKALFHYQRAMAIYQKLPPPVILDPEFDMKCKYDVTLINLNIASIRSKKGDLKGAIRSYEEGVNGLREHAEEQAALLKAGHTGEAVKSTSQHKHLVAALGRIGSLKLKMGDFDGALEAYTTLLQEVDEDSPATSRVEKAKAHIKCATIYRQEDTKESRIKSISHLREALDMYTVLFGEDHKDTTAIASSLKQWLSEDRETRTVK